VADRPTWTSDAAGGRRNQEMNNSRQTPVTFHPSAELVTALNRMADRVGHPLDDMIVEALRSCVDRNEAAGHADAVDMLGAEKRRRRFAIVPPE
jgi:predicted transcriptional regulator